MKKTMWESAINDSALTTYNKIQSLRLKRLVLKVKLHKIEKEIIQAELDIKKESQICTITPIWVGN